MNMPTPELPPLLSSILSLTKKNKKISSSLYKQFLSSSSLSSSLLLSSPINISLSYNKKEALISSFFKCNSSILKIFLFYSRMQQDAKASSFSAIETANETLSLQEFLYFCKDFKIIPKLLSMAEVTLVWRNKLNALLRKLSSSSSSLLLLFLLLVVVVLSLL